MDDGAFEALVPILETNHTLHMGGRSLLCGQGEGNRSLGKLLSALRGEVAQNLSLGQKREKCPIVRLMLTLSICASINTLENTGF